MEMYKTLNKQLVGQVQEMRNTLSEYRDEILYLRAKSLEERRVTANLRRKCVDMAKEHCRQYLDFLEPNSTVLAHLLSESGFERTSPSTNRRASQSSRLAEEARRSSSVIQTRRSFNSVSPVRSTANEEDDDDEVIEVENHVATPPILQGGIIEEVEDGDEALEYQIHRNYDDSCQESMQDTAAAASQSLSVNGSATENGVQHDDESEDDDNENEDDENDEDEEGQFISSRPHRTLRDLTNTLLTNSADESSQSLNASKKRVGRPPKSSNVAENQANVNCGSRAKNVLRTRPNTSVQRDKSARSATSFDEVRHSSRLQQDENSFGLSIHDGSYNTTATSFTLTDITMDQFRVESSSTPHNKSSPASKSARPTRRCKPTSLAERTLMSKLRNESSEESLGASNKTRTKKLKNLSHNKI